MSAVILRVADCTVDPEFTDSDAVTVTDPDGDAVVFVGIPAALRELAEAIISLADELEGS